MTDQRILIAGGGPVGLLCAWLIGRHGVPVRLFDNNSAPQKDPRAATTHPATLDLLDDALVGDMARVGLVAPIFQFWDRPSQQLVAQFDHAVLKNDTRHPFVVQCEQFKTAKLILQRLRQHPNVEVLFDHDVIDVVQSADAVTLQVRGPSGAVAQHSGVYLIGADGGRSTVRRRSGIKFEGFTWPERFIVLTTPFDFEAERGYCYRSYFADPGAWCNCFKVSADGPPGLWRTVYPTDPEQSEDDILSDAGVQARMQSFFPASRPYEIIHRNLYVTHQRVAETFRSGRVLLAGDAAHVNNPIGGMGLNGGIQDAANVADKLVRIMRDGAAEQLLDLYNLQRRTVAIEFVQEQSIANKNRLEARDPDVRRRNLDELRASAADPERARQFLLRTSMIASQRRAEGLTLADAPARPIK
jgi:3-(3-hydroxy-phenyl)propionate hydroxylase